MPSDISLRSADVTAAVELLRAGKLVAFPTETVYGLGADATRADAVLRIFMAKGRPSTNPLIVHVANEWIARRYAAEWSSVASQLALRFWPGPLTLVVKKHQSIVDAVTAGRGTVGLRVPDHPLALELLRSFDGPVAAPSANKSNQISPTTAGHVRDELGQAVDLILDGGPCTVGIESTVLDLTASVPTILRPGGVSQAQIEQVIRPVQMSQAITEVATPAAAPGQHAVHYAPRTPAFRVEGRSDFNQTSDAGLLLIGEGDGPTRRGNTYFLPGVPDLYAQHLYAALRELDQLSLSRILVQMPPDLPQWAAVRDRLLRATKPVA